MDRSQRHSRESYSASRRGFVHRHAVIGMLTMFYFTILSSDAASNEFQMPENTGCTCPGSMLIYNCTVVGTGTTIWQGTAFTCPAEAIILRHDRFTAGVAGDCNSGSIAITGRSLGVENNCYASQLVVTISSALHNKTVECVHNSNDGSSSIGSSRLTILEAPYSPPSGVQVFVVHRTNITFGWSFWVPNCTSVNYDVSSNCGSCRENTDTNSVTCYNWKVDDSNCTFSVQSVICGISGEPSNPLVVALKAPDAPQVTFIPVYSISDQRLSQVSLSINQANPLNFTTVDDTVFVGSVTNYTFYINSNLVFSEPSCMDEGCNYFVNDDDFPPTTCMTSSDISVKISASNTVGEGQASAGTLIGCTNQFVKVEYNSDTSTISCIFVNKLDRSEKMCSIKLGQCSQNNPELDSAITTTDNAMLQNVQLSESASDTFCVIARNRSYTTLVEGRTSTEIEEDPGLVRILVPIIVVLLMVLTFVVILIVILLFLLRRRRHNKTRRLEVSNNIEMQEERFTDEDLHQLIIKKKNDLNEGIIEKHSVDRDCSVKEFCAENNLTFRRGSIFYEFVNDMENISKDKRLIFMSNTSEEYFCPDFDTDRPYKMKLLGERVLKPSLKDYTVYVQSLGSGSRHLPNNTSVLYELRQVLLVDDSYFKVEVENTCTLDEFCRKHTTYGLSRECCIYIERDGCKETSGAACKDSEESSQSEGDEHKLPGQQAECIYINLKASNDDEEESKISYYEHQPEVILFNKGTETLFTGHDVSLMAERLNNSDNTRSQVINLKQWRIFERTKYNGSLQLIEGHGILVIDKLKDQQQQLSENVLTVPLCSDQFKTVKSKLFERSKLKKFQTMHNLDSSEPNVFIEVSWDSIDEQEQANVLDIVLTDKEMKTFFSCSLSPESIIFLKQHYKKEWRIFFLHKNIDKLPMNTRMLCKLDTIHWRPNSLLPVYSKHEFACEEVTTEQTLRDFCGQRLDIENCVLFTELGSLSSAMDDIDDALLIDKETGVIFTGPYARQIAKEQPSDYAEKENWKVFVRCKKPDKKAKLKPATSVYYLSLKKSETEKFEVLEVSQDKVRMSKFVEENLNLKESTFDSEKTFYEVCPDEEDLLYYKDIYLLKRKWNFKTAKYEYPNKEVVSCEYKPFYKINEAPGIGIKPDRGTRMFIRSTSYGSRCLTKGALVLYKQEK